MNNHEMTTTRTRHPASDAVRRLRIALGKTQQTFAVEVMHTAISTIGRWESNDPPTGDALKRLAAIADQHGLFQLNTEFEDLYLKWRFEGIPQMTLVPKINNNSEHAHLYAQLEGREEMRYGQGFLHALEGFRSTDPATKEKAMAILANLHELGEQLFGSKLIDKTDGAVVAAMAHGIPATAADVNVTIPQPKRGARKEKKGRRQK
jgi:transcriptional regulator with XRE-family HTH domain